MGHIHSKHILHRDIKLENVLVGEDQTVKLTDFGWSNFYTPEENRESMCGTLEYMAFEIFKGEPQTLKTDIWSLGILLYELFHKRSPFLSKNFPDIIKKVKNPKQHLCFDKDCPPEVQTLVKKILRKDPSKRPCIEAILSDPVFRSLSSFSLPNRTVKNFMKKKIDKENESSSKVKIPRNSEHSAKILFGKGN